VKLLRIILLAPLAFVRLVLIVLYMGIITFSGWIRMQLLGFDRNLQYWALKSWGRGTLFLCGVKIKRNELPAEGNYILMPNHRSYLDIFIIAGLVPSSMVAKAELANWPFFKTATKVTNIILVDRINSQSMIHTMGKIRDSVAHGIPVTLFPEGTTNKEPLTKKFKNGSFKIAADAKIPVIPVAIEYRDKNDAWVGNDTFIRHFIRQMGKPITHVQLCFGSPVYNSDYQKLQHEVKCKIDTMLSEL